MNRSVRALLGRSALMVGVLIVPISPAMAIDRAHMEKAEVMAMKAEGFLRKQQDKATGGWSLPVKQEDGTVPPNLPGITALVLRGMVMNPKVDMNDPAISGGVKYILGFRQSDGGIYDQILPSYNTALSLSALSQIKLSFAQDEIKPMQGFLRQLQWSEDADGTVGGKEAPTRITRDHPFYGGVGYGRHGRPDNSNLHMFMEAMEDSGVPSSDPAVQRALVFLGRTQMLDEVNDQPFADGSRQGGFVYATAENAESVDGRAGQSNAGKVDETLSDGTVASRLRCYGSMTYAGFKSYMYAELPKTDPRVVAAMGWIKSNYTVDENPGVGSEGQYYYYVTFSRALQAWGEPLLEVKVGDKVETRDWANDLIDKLATLQNEDGSFKAFKARWMESDPVLITAYSLIALRESQGSRIVDATESAKAPATGEANPEKSAKPMPTPALTPSGKAH